MLLIKLSTICFGKKRMVCGGIEITIDAALLAKGDVDVEHERGAVKLQLMCEWLRIIRVIKNIFNILLEFNNIKFDCIINDFHVKCFVLMCCDITETGYFLPGN